MPLPGTGRARTHRHGRRFAPGDPDLRTVRTTKRLSPVHFRARVAIHNMIHDVSTTLGSSDESLSDGVCPSDPPAASPVQCSPTLENMSMSSAGTSSRGATGVGMEKTHSGASVGQGGQTRMDRDGIENMKHSMELHDGEGDRHGGGTDTLSTRAMPATPMSSLPSSPRRLPLRMVSTVTNEEDSSQMITEMEEKEEKCKCAEMTERELQMLRRLVSNELRETTAACAARAAAAEESAAEAIRVANGVDGRLDTLRRDRLNASQMRPAVVLAEMIADAIATVILFVLCVCVARPLRFVRRVWRSWGQRQDEMGRDAGKSWEAGEREEVGRSEGAGGNVDGNVNGGDARDVQPELGRRVSRGWRLSIREFDDPFLNTVAKRISFSAAAAAALDE